MLLVPVKVVKNSKGQSLIADHDIKEGQTVWSDCNEFIEKVSKTELNKWSREKRELFLTYAWQDSDEIWSGTLTPEKDACNFINHSCDPNIWFDGDTRLVARRDIKKGEEILLDYATCDSFYLTIEDCKCGSMLCRKSIMPNDYLLMYNVYKTHFRSYLLNKMQK